MLENLVVRPRITDRRVREVQGLLLEKMTGDDKIDGLMHDETDRLAFAGHELSSCLVGTRPELNRITEADIRAWHRHLVTGPMTIAVIGRVDPSEAERLVRERFGKIDRTHGTERTPFRPAQRNLRLRLVRWPTKAAYITLSFVVPYGLGHPDRLHLSALNNHFGERQRWGTRIALRFIGDEDLRMAYSAYSQVWHHRDCGIWTTTIEVEPDHAPRALKIAAAEFASLREAKINDDDLRTTKEWLVDLSDDRQLDLVRLATFYGEQTHVAGQPLTHQEFARRVEREVTADSLLRVARQVIRRDRASVVIIGPTDRMPREKIRRALSAL